MRRLTMTAVLAIALLGAVPVAGTANEGVVGNLELLGEVGIATGTLFEGVEVGGISAIAHVGGDHCLALSDDRSELAPARFYDLAIVGKGNVVKLYEVSINGATNVIDNDDLYDEDTGTTDVFVPVSKRFLLDFGDLGLSTVDNLEGLAFGPDLEGGRALLIVASDNNFNAFQVTQFVAFAVDLNH